MELSHNSQYMDNKLSIQTDYIYQVIAFKSNCFQTQGKCNVSIRQRFIIFTLECFKKLPSLSFLPPGCKGSQLPPDPQFLGGVLWRPPASAPHCSCYKLRCGTQIQRSQDHHTGFIASGLPSCYREEGRPSCCSGLPSC